MTSMHSNAREAFLRVNELGAFVIDWREDPEGWMPDGNTPENVQFFLGYDSVDGSRKFFDWWADGGPWIDPDVLRILEEHGLKHEWENDKFLAVSCSQFT